jgi:succinate dehydrogenase/fumarate reductase flavoprotein subunit
VERNNAESVSGGGTLAVLKPPFHLVALSPLTRKSMGGVAIDMECRALDAERKPIPGLYAVGEVTGFGGLNGKAAIEGTFIAPAMLQGRIVGRAIAKAAGRAPTANPAPPTRPAAAGPEAKCATCHALEKLTATPRKGYWHFEGVHKAVLEQKLSCAQCHAEMSPFRAGMHKIDRLAQITSCEFCHLPVGQ